MSQSLLHRGLGLCFEWRLLLAVYCWLFEADIKRSGRISEICAAKVHLLSHFLFLVTGYQRTALCIWNGIHSNICQLSFLRWHYVKCWGECVQNMDETLSLTSWSSHSRDSCIHRNFFHFNFSLSPNLLSAFKNSESCFEMWIIFFWYKSISFLEWR